MKSKAHKAAIADIIRQKKSLMENLKGVVHDIPLEDDVRYTINYVDRVIKEYGLEEGILADTIEEIYDALMKCKEYSMAATLARNYGL